MRTTKAYHRGNVLALASVVVVLVFSLAAALVAVVVPYARVSHELNRGIEASYAADAGLEWVWLHVANSDHEADGRGNRWLNDLFAGPGVVRDVAGQHVELAPMMCGAAEVRVQITRRPNQEYGVTSTGRVADSVSLARDQNAGRRVTLRQDLRARDTFARFLFFADGETDAEWRARTGGQGRRAGLHLGRTTARGEIHSNSFIQFSFGGAEFFRDVTSVEEFVFNADSGATRANTTFHGRAQDREPRIAMPSVGEIRRLRGRARPEYRVEGMARHADVTLQRDSMRLRRLDNEGRVLTDEVVGLPPNGVLWVDGNVTVRGEMSGRMTIATPGQIRVDNVLRYVDTQGDPAYSLRRNGATIADIQSTGNTAWTTANGFDYVPNTAYGVNPDAEPVLGLITEQDVEITDAAPYNMEMQAAVYALGRWSCSIGTDANPNRKGNLRFLGSLVTKLDGWRYRLNYDGSDGRGYWQSGEYIYDEGLLRTAPPQWVEVPRSRRGPRWKQLQS